MRADKSKALSLRLAGKSYNEIRQQLGIPKSTLAGWFSGLVLSNKAIERIRQRVSEGSLKGLLKRNKLQTHLAKKRSLEIRASAKKELAGLTKRDLFILGVGLYWAEGYKRPIIKNGITKTFHPVSLSNSDPFLVKSFLRFLREICNIDEYKINAQLRIYEHQNEKELLVFWSKLTKIPMNKFGKFYYGVSKSSQHKRPFNILPYGTIQIRVNDTNLYHKIMGWIEALKD